MGLGHHQVVCPVEHGGLAGTRYAPSSNGLHRRNAVWDVHVIADGREHVLQEAGVAVDEASEELSRPALRQAEQAMKPAPSMAMADALAKKPLEELPDLTEEDKLARAILIELEPAARFSVAGLRKSWKNRKKSIFQGKLSAKLAKAFEDLRHAGLIQAEESSAQPPSPKRPKLLVTRGQLPGWFQKVPINCHGPETTERRRKLHVSAEVFPVAPENAAD